MVEPFSDLDLLPVNTAYQASFFGRPETGAQVVYNNRASQIEIDIEKATGRVLAQMVNRGTGSTDTSRIEVGKEGKFTNITYGWPLIETESSIASTELFDRMPGESPYSERTQQDRLTAKALKLHKEDMKRHVTTMEYLCRESLWTGQHPAILGTSNSDFIYDFYRDSSNFITVGTVWTNVAADILGDLDDAADALQQNGNLFGDYGFLVDDTAFGGLKENTVITSDADNRRYQFVALGGTIQELPTEFQKYKDNGFNPRGYVETPKGRKIWLFTYDLTFTDNFTDPENPSLEPWVPAQKGLMFHPKARCDKYFGPQDRLPFTAQEMQWYRETFGFEMGMVPEIPSVQNATILDPRMFYCDAYPGGANKSVVARTQSAPIFPTTHTDAFVVLDGLTA
jgi:hypothetical protein